MPSRWPLRRGREWLGQLGGALAALLVAVPVALFGLVTWWLPEPLVLALARGIGRLAWWVWPLGRRVAMINLRRVCGPTLSRTTAQRVSRQVLVNLASSFAEGVVVARRLRRDPASATGFWQMADPALAASLAADPRPIVFATAHFGAWEAMALLLSAHFGPRGAGIARRVDNPFVDRLLAFVRRAGHGGDPLIEKRGAAAPSLAHLRSGGCLLLLADENAGPAGPFVPFFGRPASSWKTPAVLALATGARLVVGVLERSADRRPPFTLRLEEIALNPPADGADPVRAVTAEVQVAIERFVRAAPEQWRWVHWRFKHRPDGTVERYGRRELAAAFAAASTADAGGAVGGHLAALRRDGEGRAGAAPWAGTHLGGGPEAGPTGRASAPCGLDDGRGAAGVKDGETGSEPVQSRGRATTPQASCAPASAPTASSSSPIAVATNSADGVVGPRGG